MANVTAHDKSAALLREGSDGWEVGPLREALYACLAEHKTETERLRGIIARNRERHERMAASVEERIREVRALEARIEKLEDDPTNRFIEALGKVHR